MTKYLSWDQKQVDTTNISLVTEAYDSGYVFTRTGKGVMNQTRSVRVDLMKFAPNSENRRVLRKTEDLGMEITELPLSESEYSWEIQKLGKDFYTKKFGEGTFSANKIKQLITDPENSNFNILMKFTIGGKNFGYAICYTNEQLLHYAYPFYDLDMETGNYGMGMMLKAILWAQETGRKYVYIGSATKPADKYKLQFDGLEWFDRDKGWQTDIAKLKEIIKNPTQK